MAMYQIKSWLTGAVLFGCDVPDAHSGMAARFALEKATQSRADLSRANLSSANLSRANLYGANLSRATLSGAVHAWAQIAWNGHGECGRMLTAVIYKEGEDAVLQCGCFSGSAEELNKYINEDTGQDGSGIDKYKASRMLAFETVTKLLSI